MRQRILLRTTVAQGCYVEGLYLEGAGWNVEEGHLERAKPGELIQQLPILKVVPIEVHKLKLQVSWWAR